MCNEDGTIWLVFNGEIFNAPDLRRDLERRHKFRTSHSDSEVLLHLYEEVQADLPSELNGMFAFVIYDKARRRIFGARDQLGIKPLYLWQDAGRFAFASELKSLLLLPRVERDVDTQSLFHYLTLLYVPGDASIIRGIHRLPAAHSFLYQLDNAGFRAERYWRPRFRTSVRTSANEEAEGLRFELRDAIRRWTLSDVPIACSLSGGLDPSAIVGLLAETGYPRFRTYTLGFSDTKEQPWDERARARLVAQRWGTEHQEIELRAERLLDDLVAMVWHLDEPYAGGLPAWYVFKEMSSSVKVGFTGTGGDELFGNYGKYEWYETSRINALARSLRRGSRWLADVAAATSDLTGLGLRRTLGRGDRFRGLARQLRHPFGESYYASLLYFGDTEKRTAVISPTVAAAAEDTGALLQRLYDGTRAGCLRDGLMAVDLQTQLPEEYLFMTDRFSMAHSLEARVPLLDLGLVERVLAVPAALRTRPRDTKYLLRRAVRDLLPPALLDAPKRGFVIPVELWLRRELRPLVASLLSPERLARQGLFRPDFYSRFVAPHLDGRVTYTWQIWAALMFQLWHVVFIERRERDRPSYDWRALC